MIYAMPFRHVRDYGVIDIDKGLVLEESPPRTGKGTFAITLDEPIDWSEIFPPYRSRRWPRLSRALAGHSPDL